MNIFQIFFDQTTILRAEVHEFSPKRILIDTQQSISQACSEREQLCENILCSNACLGAYGVRYRYTLLRGGGCKGSGGAESELGALSKATVEERLHAH